MLRKLSTVLFLLALVPGLLFAADGKLRGKVTDKETGEPLVGANVVVEGTALGAACDINGDFVIIGIRAGVYALKATYVGYNSTTLANVRISSDMTTTQDFKLSSSAVQVQAVEIVAQRPLIQRNTTNTVRISTQEDMKSLPLRGTQNIIGLEAGVVRQAGNLYVRGGRSGEVAYYLDGVSVTNPLFASEGTAVIQEALEEMQVQTGGFTAEFGGSNSGIVRSNLRTGGSDYHMSVDLLSDDFAKPGKEFLGTTSQGYRNIVATMSGPVPILNQLKFFLVYQNNFLRDRRYMYLTPFSFDSLVTDQYSGRGAGEHLPGPVAFKENYLPKNWQNDDQIQGTLQWDMKSFKVRAMGSYRSTTLPVGGDWNGAIANIFRQERFQENKTENSLASLRLTHVIDPSTYYEVSGWWSNRVFRNSDPDFGDDWWLYSDSTANAAIGYTNFSKRYRGAEPYSVIYGFGINNEWAPNTAYQVNKQQAIGVSVDFTRQMNRSFELKAGGKYELWTMRLFSIGNVPGLMEYMYGTTGTVTKTWANSEERRAGLSRAGTINNYGYDVDGKSVDEGIDAPRKPILASGYVQTKLEYRDLVLNFGLRYEYFKPNQKVFPDPYDPITAFNESYDIIDASKLVDGATYSLVLPRLSFSFPVTDRTVFYAQYGKYAQMPSLNQMFVGDLALSRSVSPTSRGNAYLTPVGYYMRPERTTSYEMGFRQILTDNLAFTITGFYKDTRDQIQIRQIYDETGLGVYKGYTNSDFGTVKGLELTLELRRTQRLAAKLNYTLSDARGTGSTSQTARGATEQNIARATNYILPLDFNQVHKGSALLDYRFGLEEGGPIFSGLGANLLWTFNSGHPYTKIPQLKALGQSSAWTVGTYPVSDPRFRYPGEPPNTSYTPFYMNINLGLSKMFKAGPVVMEVYAQVINLLNAKQVTQVYPVTGNADDDGWLQNPLAANFRDIPNYVAFYNAINNENRWASFANGLGELFESPRSIRLGIRAEL
jgi:outer membrane receptor protein involved in Fe transport